MCHQCRHRYKHTECACDGRQTSFAIEAGNADSQGSFKVSSLGSTARATRHKRHNEKNKQTNKQTPESSRQVRNRHRRAHSRQSFDQRTVQRTGWFHPVARGHRSTRLPARFLSCLANTFFDKSGKTRKARRSTPSMYKQEKKNNVSAPTTAVQNKDEEKGIVESTKQKSSRQRGCSFCLFIQFVFATENQHTCAILQRSRMPRKERMLMVSSSGMLVKKP